MRIKILLILMLVLMCSTSSFGLISINHDLHFDMLDDEISNTGSVCIIDSGIDYFNRAFDSCMSSDFSSEDCQVIAGYDFVEGDSNPLAQSITQDHGTLVAGVISSKNKTYGGISDDSKIVALRVLKQNDEDNLDFFPRVDDAIEWCLNSKNEFNIKAIAVSLSSRSYFNSLIWCKLDIFGIQTQINQATELGIPVFVSAGNEGWSSLDYPACLDNTISVGGADFVDHDEIYPLKETHSDPNLDFLAPGIVTTTDVNNNFDRVSGSSFANPVVAGTYLLLKKYDSGINIDQFLHLMKDNADWVDYENYKYPFINPANAVNLFDWPTFHHDNRRTGYTLLKGDINDDSKTILKFDGSPLTDFWDSPAFGNLDTDVNMEIVIGTKSQSGGYGRVFAVDDDGEEMWSTTDKLKDDKIAVASTPTIDDLDRDGKNEVIFGDRNGYLYVLDGKTGSKLAKTKITDSDYANYASSVAVADLDNNFENGKEIIVVSFIPVSGSTPKIRTYHYINNKLTLFKTANFEGNSVEYGSQFSPAIANLDTDSQPEIIVGTQLGIYIFDGKDLTLQDSKEFSLILGSPVIADVDGDELYEIIFNTICTGDTSYYDCENEQYILNINEEGEITTNINLLSDHTWYPARTSAVGDIDGDGTLEIVTALNKGTSGKIIIYNGEDGSIQEISSTMDFIEGSPSIADIIKEHQGKEIILATVHNKDWFDPNKQYGDYSLLKIMPNSLSSGSTLNIPIGTGLYGSPAIGDFDADKNAELIVTHLASSIPSSMGTFYTESNDFIPMDGPYFLTPPLEPFSYQTNGNLSISSLTNGAGLLSFGGFNKQPILTAPTEILARAGDLIKINTTAIDPNNDTIIITFAEPFNEEGIWQTTVNDTGDYTILVAADDGNLSNYKYVTVKVFKPETVILENQGLLNQQNLQLTQPLINKSRILLSRLYLEGQEEYTQTGSFQNNAQIIDINSIDNSTNNLTDNNWSSYYSAGELTGAIVEQTITPVSNPHHILTRIKAEITDGHARFAYYNYNDQVYDIVTSTLPITNGSEDFYLEIYDEDSPFQINAFALKVDNITKYINNSKIRWYYRYIDGNHYNQKIYESETKTISNLNTPKNINISTPSNNYLLSGSLQGNNIKTIPLTNQEITLNNSNYTFELKIPKNAIIQSAKLLIGNKSTTDINATMFVEEEIQPTKANSIQSSGVPFYPQAFYVDQNGTRFNINTNSTQNQFGVQDYCYDWHDSPTEGNIENYIDDVYYGPHCADEYSWHIEDVDSDGYEEHYMLKGETYSVWQRCRAETGLYSDTTIDSLKFDGSSHQCDDGSCNEDSESAMYSSTKNSVSSTIRYPTAKCTVEGSGGTAWFEYYDGNLFWYWDDDSSGDYTSGDHQEFNLVLECALNTDCSDSTYCNTYSNTNPLDNTCSTPSCSGITCEEWETTGYQNHACVCTLAEGRCDTTKYGWTNVETTEYCDTNHYPSSVSRCEDWEDSTITNHIETCTLKSDRCETPFEQINNILYCDEYHFLTTIQPTITINNTFTTAFLIDDQIDLDIGSDINTYLKNCDDTICTVPITIHSDYAISFNITQVQVEYELSYIDLTKDVQEFTKTCTNCSYTINLEKEGYNLTYNWTTYYINNTAPRITTESIEVNLEDNQTVIIETFDAENDSLIITSNNSNFYQIGNTLQWNPSFLDAGNYSINVTAYDGVETHTKIISIEIIAPIIGVSYFEPIFVNESTILYEITIGNYMQPNNQTINWNFTVGDETIQSNQTINLPLKTEHSIFLEYNFSKITNNNIEFTLFNENHTYTAHSYQYYTNPLLISTFQELFTKGSKKVFEIELKNMQDVFNLNDVFWNIEVNNQTIEGNQNYTIKSASNTKIYFEYDFVNCDNYSLQLHVYYNNNTYEKSLETRVLPPLIIRNITELYSIESRKTFDIVIENDRLWDLNLSEILIDVVIENTSYVINNLSLASGSKLHYFFDISNLSYGNNFLNFNVSNTDFSTVQRYATEIEGPFEIKNFSVLLTNNTTSIFEFDIQSGLSWNISDGTWIINTSEGVITSNSTFSIADNEKFRGFVEYTFNQTGEKNITLFVSGNDYGTSKNLFVNIK